MKKSFLVGTTMALCLVLSACSASEVASSSVASSEAVVSSEVTVSSSSEVSSVSSVASVASVAVDTSGLGDTMGDPLTFMLDGVVYSCPGSTIPDFLNNGWELDSTLVGATMPGRSDSFTYLRKGTAKIVCAFANYTETPVPIEECTIKSIKFDQDDFKKDGMIFVLPGGFTAESTYEEVLAVYGEPVKEYLAKDNDPAVPEKDYRIYTFEVGEQDFTISFSGQKITIVGLNS